MKEGVSSGGILVYFDTVECGGLFFLYKKYIFCLWGAMSTKKLGGLRFSKEKFCSEGEPRERLASVAFPFLGGRLGNPRPPR